ncbi:Rab11D, RAB family GTPase [Ectocarpus siliculosus]|uniref:Rab11D, RAB family GTPase n=1 Tax=Ectocarpus siliculosus TaxID=2880 RepID=D8LCK0_ECTSI|nr:Rab11D, RAB family GTPase [Ectocarpus siliculosus]|eukprot:CBN79513.1 Rab11D, RAB family GTPase [Ectocarpus siliculosus]
MSEEEPLKVILLGNSGVGKSNLIARFHNNDFSEDFESTVGVEFVTKRITVDGVPVKLQIWDTAGQERYASMMKTYYRKAKGSLLFYDFTNRFSFVGLEAWRKHLEANADPRCVSIVTGNKSDVSDQLVSPNDGEAYARQVSRGM